MSPVLLEVRDLHVTFPSETGPIHPVRGVSLKIRRGQRIGLIGESGSGKSLTALAVMRLIRPPGRITRGDVHLDGQDLLRLGDRAMAGLRGEKMAMIYQNPLSALNPIRRIGDQIVEAIRVHEDVGKRAARLRALELLREVGVPDPPQRIDSYPHQFSGGMRQRVVIAIAMSRNPDLLIADEPTTALDVTTQARVLDLLARLVEEHGMSLMLITHDLGVAASICDDIRVMYGGRIVEAASADHVYARPTHPYTEALLRSIIRSDSNVSEPIPAIPGQPPLPGWLPPGCSFHPRCPYAEEICRTVEPSPISLAGPEDVVAECHFAEPRYDASFAGPRSDD